MKVSRANQNTLLLVLALVLSACGVAHVKTELQQPGLDGYGSVLIGEVKVYSTETAAKNNESLQQKLKDWEAFCRNELENYVRSSKYALVTSGNVTQGSTLVADLDVNVRYGNRALRWIVKFGAGKGSVDSVLSLRDAATGEVKFKAKAESDLRIGAAGGDMGSVLESNIKKLIDQYRASQAVTR